MEWTWLLTGIGLGLITGFFIACMIGLAKESDRQAEINYWRMKCDPHDFGHGGP